MKTIKPTPALQISEEVLQTRVRHLQFFTSSPSGICLRNVLGPGNAVAVLRSFFPSRRTMLLWLLIEETEHALADLRWWWFWTWHGKILRRTRSQIEVILENKIIQLDGETEDPVVFTEDEEVG